MMLVFLLEKMDVMTKLLSFMLGVGRSNSSLIECLKQDEGNAELRGLLIHLELNVQFHENSLSVSDLMKTSGKLLSVMCFQNTICYCQCEHTCIGYRYTLYCEHYI